MCSLDNNSLHELEVVMVDSFLYKVKHDFPSFISPRFPRINQPGSSLLNSKQMCANLNIHFVVDN